MLAVMRAPRSEELPCWRGRARSVGWLAALPVLLACSTSDAPFVPPSDAGMDVPNPCRMVGRVADEVRPRVLIVLDRSGSMEGERWTAAVEAIDSVTLALEERLRLGLSFFPPPGAAECAPGGIAVEPRVSNHSAISRALGRTLPVGGTPTSFTLDHLATMLGGPDSRDFVLLVTDGAPNCNGTLRVESCTHTAPMFVSNLNCLDDVRTIASAENLYSLGVPIYVVSLDSMFPEVFDAIAAAGGTERAYPAHEPEALLGVLQEIAASLATCEFELLEEIDDPEMLNVTIDGEEVEHGEGWRFGGAGVELVGESCERLRDGAGHDVVVMRDCSVI